MSGLERSYRRLLRLYPRRYRAGRENEMLGVLLDAARPGQTRATARDAVDLALGAVRVRSADTARLAQERPAAAVGWVVLCAGPLVAVLPPSTPEPARPESLPSRFAGYSYLTGSASSSPPGPAVALYQQGWGVELGDFPQAVVVGASGAYRRLDVAEDRSGPADQGDPAPMLLSPDGARVAVGDGEAGSAWAAGPGTRADVAVQDLVTGEVRQLPVGPGGSSLPVAWSPDGQSLAVLVPEGPAHEYLWSPLNTPAEYVGPESHLQGRLVLLDAGTGAPRTLHAGAGSDRPLVAAFDPEGSRLAVQTAAGELLLVDVVAGTVQSLGSPGLALAGAAAWSPDGELLASTGPIPFVGNAQQCDGFIALDGGLVPDCVGAVSDRGHAFVGWTGSRNIAVHVLGADPAPVVDVDLMTGDRTTLSGIATAGDNYAVSRLQVPASALTSGTVGEPAGTDRGPWPLWLRLLTAAVLAALTGGVGSRVVARTRRRPSPLPVRARP